MMKQKKQLTRALLAGTMLSLTAGFLAGCGEVTVFGRVVHDGKREPASPQAPGKPVSTAQIQRLKTVSVTVLASAVQTSEDAKPDAGALLAAIKRELRSQQILDQSAAAITASGEIAIDEYALHPTSNVVLFGKIHHRGVLNGSIRVLDAQGTELSHQRIEASAQVQIPAEGTIGNALDPLYAAFAEQTASVLTGIPVKRSDPDRERPR